jgi:hypothetical protein
VTETDGARAVGLVPSGDGQGYWVILSTGTALPFGDAGSAPAPGPGYAFEVTDSAGQPARWNPCEAIGYAVVTQGAPSGWQADVADDIAQVQAATGVAFVDLGSFPSASEVPPGANLTISWVPTLPAADPLALTNFWYSEAAGYQPQITSAQIEILSGLTAGDGPDGEQPVLLHELGHAMGLAQAAGDEVMGSADVGYTTFQAGDLAGLRLLGAQEGCGDFAS